MKIAALGIMLLAVPALAAPPQTYTLSVARDGSLVGTGADVLRAQIAGAHFIMFGEDHGFADSPLILRAIAHDARPQGFHYLVEEVGPLSIRMIAATLQAQGLRGVHRLVDEVPLGIPFLDLKDDAILASDFVGTDSRGTPYLWGVDQEFIGSPPFHLKRLVELAPNDAVRAHMEQLLAAEQDAAKKGEQQNFLLVKFHDSDFDAMAQEFDGVAEAQTIIAELKESAAIYQLWMNGHNYENNQRRVRLLAKNFLADYASAGETDPKIIFKMGIEHLALGTTTINTVDLGTLVTEMARIQGASALRIAFLPLGGHNTAFRPKPGNPATVQVYKAEEAAEFFPAIGIDAASLPSDSWTLVPLEPVRQALDTQGIAKLTPTARFILLGFDYVITTPDAKAGISLY